MEPRILSPGTGPSLKFLDHRRCATCVPFPCTSTRSPRHVQGLKPPLPLGYQNAVDKLLDFLGDQADRDIAYVHKRDFAALRDKTAAEFSVSTAYTDLKILRVAFHQAVIDGLRLDNPGATVRTLEERKSSDSPERRPFYREGLEIAVRSGRGANGRASS